MAGRRPKDQVDADISAAEPAGQRGWTSPRLAAPSPHTVLAFSRYHGSLFFFLVQESTSNPKNQQFLAATVNIDSQAVLVCYIKDLSEAYPDVRWLCLLLGSVMLESGHGK